MGDKTLREDMLRFLRRILEGKGKDDQTLGNDILRLLRHVKDWIYISLHKLFFFMLIVIILVFLTTVLDKFVPGRFANVWPYVAIHIYDIFVNITVYVWSWYTNLPPGVQGALGAIIVGLFLSTQPNRFLAKRERKALANSYAAVVSSIYIKLRDHGKDLWDVYEKMEELKEECANDIEDFNIKYELNNHNIAEQREIREHSKEIERDIARSFGKRAAMIRPDKLIDFICYVNIMEKNSDKFGKMNPRAAYFLTELYIVITTKTLQYEYEILLKTLDDIEKSEESHVYKSLFAVKKYWSCVDSICLLCVRVSDYLGIKSLRKNWERDFEENIQRLNQVRELRDWKREERKVGF